jgi:hypothetical protein
LPVALHFHVPDTSYQVHPDDREFSNVPHPPSDATSPQVPPQSSQAEARANAKKRHLDELLDAALDTTFPASDPIAIIDERRSD